MAVSTRFAGGAEMAPMSHGRRQVFAVTWHQFSCFRSAMEVGAMGDYFDFRVHDLVALDEIDLYAEVLSAVAVSDRPLTLAELDDVLGVQPRAAAPVGAA
jgi:hypothetical protein